MHKEMLNKVVVDELTKDKQCWGYRFMVIYILVESFFLFTLHTRQTIFYNYLNIHFSEK